MCGETGAESNSNAEISDANSGESSSELTESDELYDADGLEDTQSKADVELFEDPSSNEEKTDGSENDEIVDSNAIENESQNASESEAVRAEINENSEYSDEVTERISSKEELEVYQKAGLKEECVNDRICLVRDEIDLDYVDPKSGMTNQELMEKGRAPYDAKTGERIELHHIGQEYDSPLAELTADSEHGQFYSTLHTKESDSWRSDEKKSNRYNNFDRPQHWKSRA